MFPIYVMHCNEDISKPTKTPQAVIHAWRRHLSLVGATTSQAKPSVFIKAMANQFELLGRFGCNTEREFYCIVLNDSMSLILVHPHKPRQGQLPPCTGCVPQSGPDD